ncbi:MAG: type II toxin-antitoxin system Phd/YefM family antitoxin [Gammaproteobacteria bacterium]
MDNIMKVGMREFRANLPQYLMTSLPVAITRHGETIGFYIPARHHHETAELDALKQAALNLERLLLSSGVTEEELFADFRAVREEKSKEFDVLQEKKEK